MDERELGTEDVEEGISERVRKQEYQSFKQSVQALKVYRIAISKPDLSSVTLRWMLYFPNDRGIGVKILIRFDVEGFEEMRVERDLVGILELVSKVLFVFESLVLLEA